MESMLAREDVELARHEREGARRALFGGIDGDEAFLERGNILLDRVCVVRRFVHFCFECVNVRRVALESGANLVLEVVDDDEGGRG